MNPGPAGLLEAQKHRDDFADLRQDYRSDVFSRSFNDL